MPAQLQLPYSATVPAKSLPSSAFTTLTCPTDATATASTAAGRSALERRARLTAKLAKLAATGHLAPLARQIAGLGGCAHPIRLMGAAEPGNAWFRSRQQVSTISAGSIDF
nr:hypothetical protein OG781_17060 [Streptomyces sp. NBC_00830]